MKKHLLLCLSVSLFFVTITSAQIRKGAIFLGGNLVLGVQRSKLDGTTDYKQSYFGISPVFGKAFKENHIIGGEINLFFSQNESVSLKQRGYGAGIFLRQYRPLGKSGFLLFLQERLGYDYIRYERTTFTEISKTHNITVSAYPGVSYTVSRKLQLETGFNNLLSLQYSSERKKELNQLTPTIRTTNTLSLVSSLNNGSTLYLGFRLLLH